MYALRLFGLGYVDEFQFKENILDHYKPIQLDLNPFYIFFVIVYCKHNYKYRTCNNRVEFFVETTL